MRTTKMTIITLEDGDQLKVWLNGVEIFMRAGVKPAITLKRYRGLYVLPSHYEGQHDEFTKGLDLLVFDQVDVIPVDEVPDDTSHQSN